MVNLQHHPNTTSVIPLRTEEDYQLALQRLEEVFLAKKGTPEHNEFLVLRDLIAAYEDKHIRPLLPPNMTPAELKAYLEERGLGRKELLDALGQPSRVSEVLRGKRKLTLQMIQKLHYTYGIPFQALIPPPDELPA